jgi:large subunit ribosomal protein L5
MARLKERYWKQILPDLQKRLGIDNPMAVPRLSKIVINMGVGKAIEDKNRLEAALQQLTMIAGQKAVPTRARKSISTFRLREGYAIGCMVTLRGRRMFEFLDRFINVVLPRIRDFRGVNPKSFDGRGNFNLGLTEQLVFPEVDPDKVNFTQGMDIAFVTTARSDDHGRELLRAFGMPFRTED